MKYQHLRSIVAGNVPPNGLPQGQLAVNIADRKLFVSDGTGFKNLSAIRIFSDLSAYAIGDFVVYAGALYRAIATVAPGPWLSMQWVRVDTTDLPITGGDITSDTLTIRSRNVMRDASVVTFYVDPSGVASPADPFAGNPFKTLTNFFNWARRRVTGDVRVNIAAGTYAETIAIQAPDAITRYRITGASPETTILECSASVPYQDSTWCQIDLTNLTIKATVPGLVARVRGLSTFNNVVFEATGETNTTAVMNVMNGAIVQLDDGMKLTLKHTTPTMPNLVLVPGSLRVLSGATLDLIGGAGRIDTWDDSCSIWLNKAGIYPNPISIFAASPVGVIAQAAGYHRTTQTQVMREWGEIRGAPSKQAVTVTYPQVFQSWSKATATPKLSTYDLEALPAGSFFITAQTTSGFTLVNNFDVAMDFDYEVYGV